MALRKDLSDATRLHLVDCSASLKESVDGLRIRTAGRPTQYFK
jgi:hypothetical protein